MKAFRSDIQTDVGDRRKLILTFPLAELLIPLPLCYIVDEGDANLKTFFIKGKISISISNRKSRLNSNWLHSLSIVVGLMSTKNIRN